LNGVPAVVEVEYRTRVFQWSIDPLLGPNGDTIGCAGVAIDITERKQDEQRIRDSERRLAQQFNKLEHIYRTAPVGLCLLDTNLRFVRINERLAAINGKPVKEHTGKTLHDIIPDIADVVEKIYNRVLETGEPVLDVEVHGKTASTGSDEGVWLVDYHPMFDRQGVISGVSSVVKDITELKRNEQQLIESEHQLAQQFDELALVYGTAPVGLCLLDAELKYVRINERLAAINGKPAEEHIGQTISDVIPEIGELVEPLCRRVLETGEPAIDFEFRGLAPGVRRESGW
jgi:PAS domain S-box-containing protein